MSLYTSGRARRSLIDTAVFRAVSQLLTILGYVVMVRGMTKEDFGVLSLLYAFIPVVSTIASLGLEQTLRRYQPQYLSAGNLSAAAWLIRFVASARFGTNVIVLSTVLLAWNHIAPLFKLAAYRAEFVMFCFLVLLHFQARILELGLATYMLQRYSVSATALLALTKLLSYLLLWSQASFTLSNAIISDTLAFSLAYAFMLHAYRKHCGLPNGVSASRPDKGQRRRLFRYGFFNNFNDAGTLVLSSKSDNFFIAAIIDPLSVGIYSFYTRLSEMAQQLLPLRLFENVVQPLFFSVPPERADEKIPNYFTLLLNTSLLLQWPILAYAVAYHAEIVQVVFGGKFSEHSWLLPIVLGFATVNVMAIPVTLVAQYEEKAAIILLSKIFAIYNIAALLILLPLMGVAGAAISSGTAQAMKNGLIWWHVRDRARWTNAGAAVLASLALWCGVVLACIFLKRTLAAPTIWHLVLGVGAIGLGLLAHIRGPAIAPTDRAILAELLQGREAALLRRVGLLNIGRR